MQGIPLKVHSWSAGQEIPWF